MTPDFYITAEDISTTESIKSSLISLHITDELGTTSDEAEICLDYSSYFEASDKLKISLGYKETGVWEFI
ncbi:hypothetical protein [Candidatus Mesenet endosymbiont of Phosphuga atrata]|uniref:hypothetical protein n=1 Tax=Candidatus Mesenet endosymbiont of Phosphuga atrata TaxID=3066221 RepID=UPI0030D57DD9